MGRATKIYMAQQILNYKFQNEDLLWEALQAPASDVALLNGRKLTQGNKGLAGVGDAVISLVIKSDCYRKDRSIGLGACINKNQSMRGFDSPRTLADTLEAVIGAVYLDGGIDNVKLAMKSLRTGAKGRLFGFNDFKGSAPHPILIHVASDPIGQGDTRKLLKPSSDTELEVVTTFRHHNAVPYYPPNMRPIFKLGLSDVVCRGVQHRTMPMPVAAAVVPGPSSIAAERAERELQGRG
ncbi:hypothetical protein FHL15_002399 [Xylaria flabelliformis]|uniref:RNase III domain-containing protein n=1 Tax=Xylaria flabelliformis TaxID=2512241 RepID=A0A553I946_9PEZI|nr:hypothetical protein FHL15_002399 [Xylaria flabelliformis]